MRSAPRRATVLPRLRMWALFLLFLTLWSALWMLNRPEPTYADQPLSYWLERMANEQTAAQASTVISEMGPEAVPALVNALRTDSSALSDFVYNTAVKIKLAPPRNYDAPNIRATAAFLLARMGEDAAPATPQLIKALGDDDPIVRYRASRALSRIGTVAISQLTLALQDREPVIRYGAAKALGGMGPQARYGAADLTKALDDPKENVRTAAFQALAQIGNRAQKQFGPEHLPHLVHALTNSNSGAARKFAVETLHAIGPAARAAVPALARARQDSPELATEIHEALTAIGK